MQSMPEYTEFSKSQSTPQCTSLVTCNLYHRQKVSTRDFCTLVALISNRFYKNVNNIKHIGLRNTQKNSRDREENILCQIIKTMSNDMNMRINLAKFEEKYVYVLIFEH